jgi:hypothetical protein
MGLFFATCCQLAKETLMFSNMNEDRQVQLLRAVMVCLFLAFAAVVRVLPHPRNSTPVGGHGVVQRGQTGSELPSVSVAAGGAVAGRCVRGVVPADVDYIYLSFCVSVVIGMAELG